MSLKAIKSKIKATIRTSKVTKAMEAVSAVKMRKSQERALQGRPYAESALRILERVSHAREVYSHPLFTKHESGKHCFIIVTSDKGLAGSLNTGVLKEAYTRILGLPKDSVELICFGKKSYEHFLRRGYTIPLHYLNVSDEVSLGDMDAVVAHVTQNFVQKKYQSVNIVYQRFISTFEQNATMSAVLPLTTEALIKMVEDITPAHGRFSAQQEQKKNAAAYTVEPSQSSVYDTLFPMLISIMVYHALLESKASEHSARMVAMKNATDKAKEVSHLLTLAYNKARQAVITREVSEITGGIEAMKS